MWGAPVREASQEPTAYHLLLFLDILPIFCSHTPSQINGSLAARITLLTDGIWWMTAPIFTVTSFCLLACPPWKNKHFKHPYDVKKYLGRVWKNSPHLLFSLVMTRVISWKATPFGIGRIIRPLILFIFHFCFQRILACEKQKVKRNLSHSLIRKMCKDLWLHYLSPQ